MQTSWSLKAAAQSAYIPKRHVDLLDQLSVYAWRLCLQRDSEMLINLAQLQYAELVIAASAMLTAAADGGINDRAKVSGELNRL